jgi:hypothetical protein
MAKKTASKYQKKYLKKMKMFAKEMKNMKNTIHCFSNVLTYFELEIFS